MYEVVGSGPLKENSSSYFVQLQNRNGNVRVLNATSLDQECVKNNTLSGRTEVWKTLPQWEATIAACGPQAM